MSQIWEFPGAVSGVLVLLSGESIHPYSRVEAEEIPPPNTLFPPSVDPNDQKKTACYDIDVEVDDPLKAQMSNFLASTTNQQEIASLDAKVQGPLRGGSPARQQGGTSRLHCRAGGSLVAAMSCSRGTGQLPFAPCHLTLTRCHLLRFMRPLNPSTS